MDNETYNIIKEPSTGLTFQRCNKKGCYYCYEMNRVNQPERVLRLPKKSSYQYGKQKMFKLSGTPFNIHKKSA